MIDFKQKLEEIDRLEKPDNDAEYEEAITNHKKRKKITTYLVAILVIALVFSGKILISSQNSSTWLPNFGIFNKLKHLVASTDKQLIGEENDRINILLLGMGGEGHDGAYLTDTIMLLSLKPSTKQVSLVSLPRDLTAPISNSGWQKINSINAYAEAENPGSGGKVTTTALGSLLQIPIDYYIRVDFNGFIKIIDELGGVEIEVENLLDDYSYPIFGQEDNPNYYARFEHLHIEPGRQKMSGALALKYARSRHAAGLEGSDFARARRQQLLLEAVKNKLLSRQTLLNPVMVGKLISEFNKNISTNLSVWELLRLWELSKDINREQIINRVLSDAPDGLLVSGQGDNGAYILTPRTGNFSQIRGVIQNIFETAPSSDNSAPENKTKKISKPANVLIYNGTWITGLASRSAAKLIDSGFLIAQTDNAPTRDYTTSTVYNLNNQENPEAWKTLQDITQAQPESVLPEWLKELATNNPGVNYILILGTAADQIE